MGRRENKTERAWILLVHQLPQKPTNLRVRVWRKLQQLGSVPVKNSVYVLPFNEKTHEDFQWLKQEIETSGGEAIVFRAGSVEGATDDEIIRLFRIARDEDYSRVTAELDALAGALREQKRGGHLSPGRLARYEAELEKLHGELERVVALDFFDARAGAAASSAYQKSQQLLRATQAHKAQSLTTKAAGLSTSDLREYQARRWITRRNLHIDRLASVWLITRFIDQKPRFFFVADGQPMEGGIHFDMFGAELTHVGDNCTFETMLKRFGLGGDAALRAIAEIVHDIDLKDRKFNRTEAAGLDATVSGLALLLKDDRKLIRQTNVVFDGFYKLLSEFVSRSGPRKGAVKKSQSGTKKRGRRKG
ncbi:MAG TPA: chromate resistance protein ChrB domain-containing protein [Blastocatellia bacterium]|nr:chromate resistance protein ChrB domain-containing protein [Blastocatellia bacterium]